MSVELCVLRFSRRLNFGGLSVFLQEHGTGAADADQSEGHESELMARLASRKQSRKNTQVFYSFID